MPDRPSNPFFHRGPIRDAEHFFDRQTETSQALNLISNLQNVAIIGQRRIGKTSFLFHLARPEIFDAAGLAAETTAMAHLDGEEFAALEPADVYGFIVRRLGASLPSGAPSAPPPARLTYHEFRQQVEQMHTRGLTLVVFIDEFESLAANAALTPAFFSSLRALATQYRLVFVTASRDSLFDLTYTRASTLSSPFFNTFAHLRLGLFTEAAADYLLETLARLAATAFPADLSQRILTLAGPHPFLLQLAAFHAFEALTAAEPGRGDGAGWEHYFEADARPHFEYYWQHLSGDARSALARLPWAGGKVTRPLQALADAALVRHTPEGWVYLSPALERFARQQAVPGLLQFGPLVLDLARRCAAGSGGPLKLTKTEFDALAFMVQNAGRVVSPAEIEQALWAAEYIEDPERVRSLMKSLRRALGDDGHCLATRWGEGYLLQAPA